MRVGFLSDLHINGNGRFDFCRRVAEVCAEMALDYLVLLGDIGGGADETLQFCRQLDGAIEAELRVVAGNHDLYVPDYKRLSPEAIRAASADFYRRITYVSPYSLLLHPIVTERWFITGLGGWYDYSFARGYPQINLAQASRNRVARWCWSDSRRIRGGEPDYRIDVARVDEDIRTLYQALTSEEAKGKRLCAVTHMLPTRKLVRRLPVPYYSHFRQLLGSERYRQLYEKVGVSLSISGHSHMPMLRYVNGIEYANVSLGHYWLWRTPFSARREIARVMYVLDA